VVMSGSFAVTATGAEAPDRHARGKTANSAIFFRFLATTGRSLQVYYYGSIVLRVPRGNPSIKLAITVDPDVHSEVIEAAEAEGLSVSAWMTEAARRVLRVRDGLAAVGEWEREHGALTAQELATARRRLAIPRGRPKRAGR
jgi:hypothetical protein